MSVKKSTCSQYFVFSTKKYQKPHSAIPSRACLVMGHVLGPAIGGVDAGSLLVATGFLLNKQIPPTALRVKKDQRMGVQEV